MHKINEYIRLARLARADAERAEKASHRDALNMIAGEWLVLADERRRVLEMRAKFAALPAATVEQASAPSRH